MSIYIIQSTPNDQGCREFFRASSPELPTIKVGVCHDWGIVATRYDLDRSALIANGAERLGSSPWLNLSAVPCDPRPGAFEWRDWFGERLAKLDP